METKEKIWYNKNMVTSMAKRSYGGIPLGFTVRKSIGKTITFRLRHGNGVNGSIAGMLYQDRFTYKVPTSINNPQGQAARDAMTTAMHNWKYHLTEAEKEVWRIKARRKGGTQPWSEYAGAYIKAHA